MRDHVDPGDGDHQGPVEAGERRQSQNEYFVVGNHHGEDSAMLYRDDDYALVESDDDEGFLIVDDRTCSSSPEVNSKRKEIELLSLTSATVIAVGCIGMVEYSMVMPSLAKYVKELGQTNVFYGVCQASFSLSRLLFMPVLGQWSDRRPMIEPFMFCIAVAIAGNVLYALAFGLRNAELILIARILVGLGAANSTLAMSFITRITEKEKRTKAMATLSGLNLIGIVIGPATNLLVTEVHYQVGNSIIILNELTNPGWLMVVLLLGLFILTFVTFKEPPRLVKPTTETPSMRSPLISHNTTQSPYSTTARRPSVISFFSDEATEPIIDTASIHQQMQQENVTFCALIRRLGERSLWVHFVISFCVSFVLNELETALPALTSHDFHWTTIDNSYMYAGLGLSVALAIIFVVTASRCISDRVFISFGLTTLLVGLIVAITSCRTTPQMSVFVVCVFLISSATPIVGSPNMSLFSKRLEENENLATSAGLYIGLLQGVEGISRVAAPLYAGIALTNLDDHLNVYIGPIIMMGLVLMIVVLKIDTIRERSLI